MGGVSNRIPAANSSFYPFADSCAVSLDAQPPPRPPLAAAAAADSARAQPALADARCLGWLMFVDGQTPAQALHAGAELALGGKQWRVVRVQADESLLLEAETTSDDRLLVWQRAVEDVDHELLKRREENEALSGDITALMHAMHQVGRARVKCVSVRAGGVGVFWHVLEESAHGAMLVSQCRPHAGF